MCVCLQGVRPFIASSNQFCKGVAGAMRAGYAAWVPNRLDLRLVRICWTLSDHSWVCDCWPGTFFDPCFLLIGNDRKRRIHGEPLSGVPQASRIMWEMECPEQADDWCVCCYKWCCF